MNKPEFTYTESETRMIAHFAAMLGDRLPNFFEHGIPNLHDECMKLAQIWHDSHFLNTDWEAVTMGDIPSPIDPSCADHDDSLYFWAQTMLNSKLENHR